MNTQTLRLPLDDKTKPLPDRISELCEVQRIAGFILMSTFVYADNLFLIFQKTT